MNTGDTEIAVARKAMMGGEDVMVPTIAVPVVAIPETAPISLKSKLPSLATVKRVCNHAAFRLVMVFLVTCILLLIIHPPFVQVRKAKNDLEKAPCSYGRVMVVAAVVTGVVALVPLALKHKEKVMATLKKITPNITL